MLKALESIQEEQARHEARDERREEQTDKRFETLEAAIQRMERKLADGLAEIGNVVKNLTDAKIDNAGFERGVAVTMTKIKESKRTNPWVIGIACALAPVILVLIFGTIDFAARYYIEQSAHIASSSISTTTTATVDHPRR